MMEVNEGWIWKFDRWVIETEKELIYKPIAERIGDGIKHIAVSVWDWFVPLLPDIIGFGAVATGVFVILSAMIGRGVVKPLAVFSGATILVACILEAN